MTPADFKAEMTKVKGLTKYIKRAKDRGNPKKVAILCKEKLAAIQKIKQSQKLS